MNALYTTSERSRALLLVSAVIVYYAAVEWFAVHASFSVANGAWFGVVYQGLRLLLMLAGLQIAARFWRVDLATHQNGYPAEVSPLGWRRTAGSGYHLGMGAALGWGIAVGLVVPIALDGGLALTFDWSASAWARLCLILVAAALGSTLRQTVFSGFVFRRLGDAVGPHAAVVLVALFAGVATVHDLAGSWSALLVVIMFQALCCVAALRTGSLWLGLGLDFCSRIFLGTFFGFAVLGSPQYSSNVVASSGAPWWLTGGSYGPAGSILAPVVLVAAFVALRRMTAIDFIANIRPGGIPMDVAERHAPGFPAAPVAPAGVSLVQIGAPPLTPDVDGLTRNQD